MTRRVYLDWAATAPLCAAAAEAMRPYFAAAGGAGDGAVGFAANLNANSLHSEGRAAFAAMEDARARLARVLGARPDEVVFTAGATEADNLAVVGMALAERDRRLRRQAGGFTPHVVTTAIEHDAVLQPARLLARLGFKVDFLSPDRGGFVSAEQVRAAMRPETVLVSVMLANNEVGALQPVEEIARAAHEAGALVHTDAVQALGKVPVSLKGLGVDALSVSAHKIGGPKGVGALVLRAGVPCEPLVRGGGQESGRRSGTQNVAGMAGFAAAAEAACGADRPAQAARQRKLRDRLYAGLLAHAGVVQSVPCGPADERYLPNVVNVCVPGLESETLVLRFDRLGCAVAGGSACSSHSLDPSHVLSALGVPHDTALCSLRLSIGPSTTEADVDAALAAFETVIDWKG